MKKTDWYPASVKPVREGWYEVQRFRGFHRDRMPRHMLRWTGCEWEYVYRFELMSAGGYAFMDPRCGDKWRGLTERAA